MSDLHQLKPQSNSQSLAEPYLADGTDSCRDWLAVLLELQQWRGCYISDLQQFMARYTRRLAVRLGLSAEVVHLLEMAVQVYRLGLVGLPDALIRTPFYALTVDQRVQLASYPELGAQALARSAVLQPVADLVRDYRPWGSVPELDNSDDAALAPASKILSIVNDYYELMSGRLAQGCSGKAAAAEHLLAWAGMHYDTDLVQALLLEVEDFVVVCERTTAKRMLAELEPGLMLADDLTGDSGGALLVAGTVLTEAHIRTLHRHASRLQHPLVATVQVLCDQ